MTASVYATVRYSTCSNRATLDRICAGHRKHYQYLYTPVYTPKTRNFELNVFRRFLGVKGVKSPSPRRDYRAKESWRIEPSGTPFSSWLRHAHLVTYSVAGSGIRKSKLTQ